MNVYLALLSSYCCPAELCFAERYNISAFKWGFMVWLNMNMRIKKDQKFPITPENTHRWNIQLDFSKFIIKLQFSIMPSEIIWCCWSEWKSRHQVSRSVKNRFKVCNNTQLLLKRLIFSLNLLHMNVTELNHSSLSYMLYPVCVMGRVVSTPTD